MEADEQGAAGQQGVGAGLFGGQEEQGEVEGEAGHDAGQARPTHAGDALRQGIKLILRRTDDQGEQAERSLLGDGEEAADPDDESDDDPEADGAEGAIFHA